VHCYSDEIDFGDSRPGVKNILGGAASFAVVGARLVSGSKYARSVSWIVDVGSDFPTETLDVIKSWNTSCVFREDPSRLTTRAWNGYHPDEKRGKFLISCEGMDVVTDSDRLQILDTETKTRA
jgi:hypothetical protein